MGDKVSMKTRLAWIWLTMIRTLDFFDNWEVIGGFLTGKWFVLIYALLFLKFILGRHSR